MMAQALATTEVTQLYTLLSLSHRSLMIPQSDVRTLAPVLDVHPADPPMHGVGWLSFVGTLWPVYCLDNDLNPLSQPLSTHRLCALCVHGEGYFGLLCTHVVTVQSAETRVRPLPAAMTTPHTPLRGLACRGDQVILVSTAAALAEFLELHKADSVA